MAGNIKISFAIAGREDVLRAMQGISQAAARMGRQGAQAVANEQKAAAREALEAQKRAAREAADAQKKAARDAVAAQKAAAKEAAAAQKAAAKEAADFQREMDRSAARNFRERVRDNLRAEREAAREQTRIVRDAQRQAQQSSNSGKSAFRDMTGGAARGFRSGVGTVASVGALAVGGFGMSSITGAVEERLKLGAMNAQLAADTNEAGKAPIDQAELARRQQAVAKNTGIAATSVAEAMNVAAGEGGGRKGLDVFNGALEEMGQIALASGTKLEDIAKISATLTNNMVTDSKEQVEAITNLLGAAKKNNVNLRDEAEKIMAVAGAHLSGNFEGTGRSRVEQSGALMQIAKLGGASNREDAATAARNFYNDLSVHEKDARKLGVKTVDKTTGKRVDAVEQFIQLLEKTKGDVTKIDPLFGTQSASVTGALGAAFRGENTDLKDDQGRVLSGRDAVQKLLTESATGNMSFADVQKDAAIVKADPSNQIARTMEDFKAKVGNELLPVLTDNIGNFAKLATAVADATKYVVEHPAKAAAGFIALTTAMGAFEAGIGKFATLALDKLFSKATPAMTVTAGVVNVAGGKPPVPGGTPTPGAGGGGLGATPVGAATGLQKAGAVGAGAAIGIGLGVVTAEAIDKDLDKTKDRGILAQGLASRIKGGVASEAERKQAQELAASMQEDQKRSALGLVWKNATAGARGLMSGDISAGNIASTLPPIAALRGIVGGALEGQQISTDKNADPGLAALKEALAAPTKLDPGTTINIGNVADLAAAVNNNAQGPKVQGP